MDASNTFLQLFCFCFKKVPHLKNTIVKERLSGASLWLKGRHDNSALMNPASVISTIAVEAQLNRSLADELVGGGAAFMGS